MIDPIPNGTRAQVKRRNGETVTGYTFGPIPWLLHIGEYYQLMMEHPVTIERQSITWQMDETKPLAPVWKPRKGKKTKTQTYSIHGTYRRQMLTIL